MFSCLLCGKEYSTQRGLFGHLTRVHNIREQKQKLSLYVIADFFPLIEKRSWTKAETILEELKKETKNNEWTMGYMLALEGMIYALKEETTQEPFIDRLEIVLSANYSIFEHRMVRTQISRTELGA